LECREALCNNLELRGWEKGAFSMLHHLCDKQLSEYLLN